MKILLLTSLLAAAATALSPLPGRSIPFKLRADPPFSPHFAGFLERNGQTLQWGSNSTTTTTIYEAFYDYKTKTVNATDGSGIFYLRPTHGTPMFYVFSGDPSKDPAPALTISTWTFRNANSKTYLGPPEFMGCPSSPKGPSTVYLYYGGSVSRCGSNFGLEVVFKTVPQPTETVTETETATETATETETETCTTEEPEPTETCTTEEPEPTETETCTSEEPEPTEDPTATPPPPPGTNTTVSPPPVPTETEDPEPEPVPAAASGLRVGGMYFALVVAGGMAVWVL